jgi:phosphate transport system substrate-binding protein
MVMMYQRKGISKLLALMIILILVVIIAVSPSIFYRNKSMIYLKGSGASFPYPLIQELIEKYRGVNPSVEIDYASVGSGAGQADLMNKLVDFAGSDAPLTGEQLNKVNWTILHIPYALGAVAISYNIPGAREDLKLTPDLISLIFGGKIERWNDERLVKINPWLKNINKSITVIHRSDSSGTTYIFTLYLSLESPFWKNNFGVGKMVSWPTLGRFIGGKGNEGVSGLIIQTPYSIGYIEFTYAYKESLSMAEIKNKAGNFIKPSMLSIAAAGAINAEKLDPSDLRISRLIIDSNVSNAYPISAPTYFLIYRDWSIYQGDPRVLRSKEIALKDWIAWILHDGVQYYYKLGYVPLPEDTRNIVMEVLDMMTFNGEPI